MLLATDMYSGYIKIAFIYLTVGYPDTTFHVARPLFSLTKIGSQHDHVGLVAVERV